MTYIPPRFDDDDDEGFSPVGEDGGDEGHNPFSQMLSEAQRMLSEAFENAQQQEQQRGRRTPATPHLDQFSTDLTEQARALELDPVVGRETEIRRVTEVLCRRRKNNPVLIGEPGVGKSAIVEGLAQQIAEGTASPMLLGKRLISLDLTAIVAGTKYRGEFEERIKEIINELEGSDDIIVFIDEIHTLIGAGSAPGTMDAANILKPALSSGTIQCIGATTLDEYRHSIEKDGALERRFQKIIVSPTTADETLHILQNVKGQYERHHHVWYSDEALKACVKLTERYVTARVFPDKAIDALDEAGARVRLRTATVPRGLKEMELDLEAMRQNKEDAVAAQKFELAARYRDDQQELAEKIAAIREKANAAPRRPATVTEDDVNAVVSVMSGVPVQRVSEGEAAQLRLMEERLKAVVIGQDHAVETVTRCIRRNRLGLRDSRRPIGAFLFLGPTGVGKTYLAQQIAQQIYGSGEALIRIDMSEYNESFNTSRLVGAPPGYVGYDEGGQLTERVRRRPYSVVLLDEIEKAHANVYNLLLQVLDEGRLTDGNGRLIDFRNTIIVMTSNTGSRQLKDFAHGVGFHSADDNPERQQAIIDKALKRQFAPEFLNRLDEVVTFSQLTAPSLRRIIDIEMKSLYKRVSDLGLTLRMSSKAKDIVAEAGYDVQFGARPLKRAVQRLVEDKLCDILLNEPPTEGSVIKIGCKAKSNELTFEVQGNDKQGKD